MNKPLRSAHLIFDLNGVLFEKKQGLTQTIYLPITPCIEILKECAQLRNTNNKPLHKLYVLSNASTFSLAALQNQFPDIFALFKGIHISSIVGLSKPDQGFFRYFLNAHKLDASECIFIDDALVNVEAGESIGITGILYITAQNLRQILQILDILPH